MEKINFHYCLEIDYDEENNCEEEGCDEDICRCGRIYNASVREVNLKEIIDHIKNNCLDKKIIKKLNIDVETLSYGIDRIVRHVKMYDKTLYDVEVENGYYGQEIGSVYFNDDEKLQNILKEFIESDNPVEFLLNMEYGFVLPKLLNSKWMIENVDINLIVAGRKEYEKQVKIKDNPYNDKYNGVVCVCYKDSGFYRIIDGYHRFSAVKSNIKSKNVYIILAQDKHYTTNRLDGIE